MERSVLGRPDVMVAMRIDQPFDGRKASEKQ